MNTNATKILASHNLKYEDFKRNLVKIVGQANKKSSIALYTPLLKRIISGALDDAKEQGLDKVKTEHLLISMLEEGEGIGIRILIKGAFNLRRCEHTYDCTYNYKNICWIPESIIHTLSPLTNKNILLIMCY